MWSAIAVMGLTDLFYPYVLYINKKKKSVCWWHLKLPHFTTTTTT